MSTLGTWAINVNIFINAIRGSYVTAQTISNFYLDKLNANIADPDIALLHTNFLPFDTAINETYSTFIVQGGVQSGASETFGQRLGEMTLNLDQWDSSAKLIYPPATESGPYTVLFPNGHAPYQTGTQLSRLNAVKNLIGALNLSAVNDAANAVALTALKTTVNNYYTVLKKAFDEKNKGKNVSSIQSDACFDASIAVCEQMYIGLAALMIKFYKTPDVIGDYFDEYTIRGSRQTDFSHIVKSLHTFTIAQRTLAPASQIRINNTGDSILRFYAANVKDGAIAAVFIEAAPGSNASFASSLLGDLTNNHFIMVYNPDTIQEGSFELSLL